MKANNEQIKDGVVSIFDPKDFEIEWRDIPDLENYQASNIGTIRSKNKFDTWIYRKPTKCKTTVGSYLYVVYSKDGFSKQLPYHHLICKAFHGMPPKSDKRYEANHKDGNKHNNLPSNLEWCTHSENMFHALQNGLRKDNIEIEVYDRLTDTYVNYYSIIEFSRQFNIPRNDAKILISRYNETPYQDRWIFKINLSKLGKINRPHFERIKAKDYVNDKILVADDATIMQYCTGIGATTILLRIGRKKYKVKNPDTMIGGYVFKIFNDETPFPSYSKSEAVASREKYFNRNPKPKIEPILVRDYRTGTVIEYKKLAEACIKEDVKYLTITAKMNKYKELFLHEGKCFKRFSDDRKWPSFTDEEILKSLTTIKK